MTISEIENGIKDCLDTINNLRDDLASAERERAHQQGRADRNAAEYAREQKKREQLQAENARMRKAIEMAIDCIQDKDVIGARLTLTLALGETQ
jgi:septal ring factor EnvC (AmiA/AmiB activator)